MAILFVDRRGVRLSLESGALAVRGPEGLLQRLPLTLVDRVVIRCHVELTSGVLLGLAARGVSVAMVDGRGRDGAALLLSGAGREARRRAALYGIWHDPERRADWARRLVAAKIRGQQRLLARALEERPDLGGALLPALRRVGAVLESVRTTPGAPVPTLMGWEGAASAAYFPAYAALFPPALELSGRTRRPPKDPVNACLSLGYTLLTHLTTAELQGAGLDPLAGFFHAWAHSRPALACDLVEPLRPRLDWWVWELFRSRTLRAEHFGRQNGQCLLGKAGRAAYYGAYGEWEGRQRGRVRRLCRLLVRALRSGEGETGDDDDEEPLPAAAAGGDGDGGRAGAGGAPAGDGPAALPAGEGVDHLRGAGGDLVG